MTKNKLYDSLGLPSEMYKSDTEKYLDEFFSQNVVIPKGENRHPYADVYHEAVEGKDWQWSEDGVNWYDVVPPRYQYRIKPAEPEFEYLYYSPEGDIKWMTLQESETNVYFIQAKETKRVRQ